MKAKKKYKFDPDWTLSPYVLLKEAMDYGGVSAYEILRAIVENETALTACAEVIERETGYPASTLINGQRRYQSDLERGLTDLSDEHLTEQGDD